MAASPITEGRADRNTTRAVGGSSVDSSASPGEFEDFYKSQCRQLITLVMRMGASMEEACDAVQEAMIAAFQHWSTIQHPAAWARTVAVRAFMNSVRRRRAEDPRALAALQVEANPAAAAPALEERQRVLAALQALPPTQRAVMAFVYDGYTAAETAEILGKTPDTVRSNLMHARRHLKRFLAEDLDRVDGGTPPVRLSYQVGDPHGRVHRRVVSVRADRDCAGLDLLVVAAPGPTKPETVADGELLDRFSGLALVGGEIETFDVELPGRAREPYLLRCFVEPPDRFAIVDPPIHQLMAA